MTADGQTELIAARITAKAGTRLISIKPDTFTATVNKPTARPERNRDHTGKKLRTTIKCRNIKGIYHCRGMNPGALNLAYLDIRTCRKASEALKAESLN